MFLLDSNVKLRGLRHAKRLYRPSSVNRKLVFYVTGGAKKPNLYHKTQQFKFAHSPLLRLNAPIPKWYFFCVDLFRLRTRYSGVFKSPQGSFFIAPLVESVQLASKVTWLRNAYTKFFFLSVGIITRVRFLKLATLISNIGYDKPQWATAQGCYSVIKLMRPKSITITLPSGEWRVLTREASAIVGRNSGSSHNKEVLGKASAIHRSHRRVIVRSCAKNPVDHPNGGRTRGKTLIKTPWGKPAKSSK